MKLRLKMLLFVPALCLIASAGIASQEISKPAAPDFNALQTAASKPADSDAVMAVVDGKALTAGQLDEIAQDMDPNLARLPVEQRRLTVLKIYLDMQALAHAALQDGLDKTPAYEKRMALMRNNVLQQIYFQNMIVDKISDADIKARYDKEMAALPKEEEVHARHILVKTKKEAEDIIKRLDKGENFEDIAKKSSTDGSAAVGGDLGYFSRGQMVKPFEDAAFALKKGGYTKIPVESPFGWHVIKVEDRRQKPLPAFADVKEVLRNMIARERYGEVSKDLRAKLSITYPDPKVGALLDAQDAQDDSLPGEHLQDEDQD
ncbi:peptidylprolyl isomerase [Bartonella sp. DGB2]|uniref:peptidylprolyl isomerase n=1 Tax=Bartonella sp. DGB2 TaxID=3388426 RepID=UPI00398FB44D